MRLLKMAKESEVREGKKTFNYHLKSMACNKLQAPGIKTEEIVSHTPVTGSVIFLSSQELGRLVTPKLLGRDRISIMEVKNRENVEGRKNEQKLLT